MIYLEEGFIDISENLQDDLSFKRYSNNTFCSYLVSNYNPSPQDEQHKKTDFSCFKNELTRKF